MSGKLLSARMRQIALPLFLLSASIASAHPADGGREAGFSRVKISFRTRSWKDDPASIPILSSDQHVQGGSLDTDGD